MTSSVSAEFSLMSRISTRIRGPTFSKCPKVRFYLGGPFPLTDLDGKQCQVGDCETCFSSRLHFSIFLLSRRVSLALSYSREQMVCSRRGSLGALSKEMITMFYL